MRLSGSRGRCIVILLLSLLAMGCRDEASLARPGEQSYLVGAYYNLWYPEAFGGGYLRERLAPPQRPALGEYSSEKVEVAERHIELASRHGIDFFCLDFWPGWSDFDDRVDVFLGAENLEDVKFCIFYETGGLGYSSEAGGTYIGEKEVQQFEAEMERIGRQFFSHPRYLKINGRPVVILYLTRTLYGRYAEAIEGARRIWREQGYEVLLIGDEIFWDVAPVGVTRADEPLALTDEPQPERISLFDALTSYNFYRSTRDSHRGYGARSDFLKDVGELTRKYAEVGGGEVPVIPSAVPGYNDRGFRLSEDHFPIPRRWREGDEEGSFFDHMLADYALPAVDRRLPLLLITSWNEWNEDTAIEPAAPSPSTSEDQSGKEAYTQGFQYAGFGNAYLEVLRNRVVAVTGRLTTPKGDPISGATVYARGGGRTVSSVSDSQGYFRFSSLLLGPGDYLIGPDEASSRRVTVTAGKAQTADFELPSGTAGRPPRLGIWDYASELPGSEASTKQEDGFRIYSSTSMPEPALSALYQKILRPGDVAVDVGAGEGGSTLLMSRAVGASGRVYAFEPRREPFRFLRHNLRLNDLENVKPVPRLPGHISARVGRYGEKFDISPLDALSLEGVRLLRINLPDYEGQVLRGARATIRREKPEILIEGSRSGVESSLRNLRDLGYEIVEVEKDHLLAKPPIDDAGRKFVDVGLPEAHRYLKKGFQPDEVEPSASFAWSKGGESLAVIPLEKASGPYELGVRAHAMPEIAPVGVKVEFNGNAVGQFSLDRTWRTVRLEVSPELVEAGPNEIKFRYSKTARPADLDPSDPDRREISVAFDCIWLKPASGQ